MSDELDARARARIGEVLNDKWTLESLIGVGGMAAVYAARHRNGARAAIKVLHPELTRHEEIAERFRREGYAANKVEHAGVVKVLDDDVIATGEDAGAVYIVMELLEGESLQDRIERSPPLGERALLVIADAVLEVLEAAHARGVVHRDIKPENIFLLRHEGTDVRIKILDFGLARVQEAQSITTHGLALGTPSYMSPEQAAGKTADIDGRTDLFAVAATMFRILTGARIHEGQGPVDLVSKMAQLPAPAIRSIAPHVSEPFARVVDCALQFRREDRYPSATVMRADVQKAIDEIDREVALRKTVEVSAVHLEEARLPPPLPLHRAKKRSVLPWLVIIALAAALVVIVIEPGWRERLFGEAPPPPSAPAIASSSPDADVPPEDASVVVEASAPIADAGDGSSDADDDDDDDDAATDASPGDHESPDTLDAGRPEAAAVKRPLPPKRPPPKPVRRKKKR